MDLDAAAEGPASAHGAGVAAVCLAVLGAAGIGALWVRRSAHGRTARASTGPARPSPLAYAPHPVPPPAGPRALCRNVYHAESGMMTVLGYRK